jgi:hypothetical protein
VRAFSPPIWPKEVRILRGADSQVRRVYRNVPHLANPTPSWYGESVGHYEGDTLVIDTIGLHTKTLVDYYRTPHTEKLHVVERWRIAQNVCSRPIRGRGSLVIPIGSHFRNRHCLVMLGRNCDGTRAHPTAAPGNVAWPRRSGRATASFPCEYAVGAAARDWAND